jgi:hypothetical protein
MPKNTTDEKTLDVPQAPEGQEPQDTKPEFETVSKPEASAPTAKQEKGEDMVLKALPTAEGRTVGEVIKHGATGRRFSVRAARPCPHCLKFGGNGILPQRWVEMAPEATSTPDVSANGA